MIQVHDPRLFIDILQAFASSHLHFFIIHRKICCLCDGLKEKNEFASFFLALFSFKALIYRCPIHILNADFFVCIDCTSGSSMKLFNRNCFLFVAQNSSDKGCTSIIIPK